MKLYIKSLCLILGLSLVGSSCTKEDVTADVSRVTYFVDLSLNGDPQVFLKQNEAYSDPGAEASENGSAVEVKKQGAVDPAAPGFYNLAYSAVNSDGFASTVNRTVVVYEPQPITGVYDGTRVGRNGGLVLIKTEDETTFHISDLLAGHYEFGRGFGIAFAAPATIKIDGDKFTTDGGVCGFGPVVVDEVSISEDKNTWTWKATLTDFDFSFEVSLNKLTE